MASVTTRLPRVAIQFCTECKWMLRAAYFAQELLSTFGTTLGEVALQPSTGGTFTVSLYSTTFTTKDDICVQHHVLWDRKAEGGFPETKELKKRVRDIIEPGRDLGHVDGKKSVAGKNATALSQGSQSSNKNEDSIEVATQQKEIEGGEDVSQLSVINNVEVHGQELEMKYTLMDLDIIKIRSEKRDKEVKRNLDGSICDDCN